MQSKCSSHFISTLFFFSFEKKGCSNFYFLFIWYIISKLILCVPKKHILKSLLVLRALHIHYIMIEKKKITKKHVDENSRSWLRSVIRSWTWCGSARPSPTIWLRRPSPISRTSAASPRSGTSPPPPVSVCHVIGWFFLHTLWWPNCRCAKLKSERRALWSGASGAI